LVGGGLEVDALFHLFILSKVRMDDVLQSKDIDLLQVIKSVFLDINRFLLVKLQDLFLVGLKLLALGTYHLRMETDPGGVEKGVKITLHGLIPHLRSIKVVQVLL
jgi:hypothetical protein